MTRRLLFAPLSEGESTYLGDLFRRETVGGAVALVAAAIAVAWANSPWASSYEDLRQLSLGPLDLEHWAADGALTLFFFVAGLELKREFVVGSLRRPSDAAVPITAAVAGVALPAAIYLSVNTRVGGDLQGWAVPSATDIAFALAVLAVVGSNLPGSLRAFLLTLAVVDDLIVIAIIAVFYTSSLAWAPLLGAVVLVVAWGVLQRLGLTSPLLLVPIALGAWWLTHESGIHATVAGVTLGLLTRVRPAARLEHLLSPVSAAVAVPFFALMSAGVSFGGDLWGNPIVIGVILGLLLGKPVGVLLGAWLVTRWTRAELSDDLSWRDLIGVALLAGIGFTVSLLVSDLSFVGEVRASAKAAVLIGTVIAAIAGALALGHRDRFHATP